MALLSFCVFRQVSFRVSPGEDMSFCADNSVDLVTSAQAMHWFDLDKFYAEVKRVLKRSGVLATYGYVIPVCDNPQATQHIKKVNAETLFFHARSLSRLSIQLHL